MAKKQKRSVSATSKSRKASSNEFAPDYTFIRKDLRKISIMAASFFVILVALSFFLN